MPKLTVEDLERIKQKTNRATRLSDEKNRIKITVHMGTCGLAAGAQDVMDALTKEVAEAKRDDIRVVASGCMGMCSSEPNVTVEVLDKEPVVYQHMNANRMRQVFRRHVLLGEVQTDFALARI
jgi:NADP-reducing hydrogenase subunit HndB